MKENVINILMYLLQNVSMEGEAVQHDHEKLKALLVNAGFANSEIHEAFRWLDDLDAQISQQVPIEYRGPSTRCFSRIEETLLGTGCQGYLLGLANAGILTPNSFELVIDRLHALNTGNVELDQLEWIVLVVLSNQSDQQTALQRLEATVFYDSSSRLH